VGFKAPSLIFFFKGKFHCSQKPKNNLINQVNPGANYRVELKTCLRTAPAWLLTRQPAGATPSIRPAHTSKVPLVYDYKRAEELNYSIFKTFKPPFQLCLIKLLPLVPAFQTQKAKQLPSGQCSI
jgi:hypothetical protein